MRKDTDEQVHNYAESATDIFVEKYGKGLDEEQRAEFRAEIYPIAMREALETREAAAPYGVYSTTADDECLRVWHRSFRDMSAVAAKYGIDTGFEKISKNWQF